MNDGAVQQVDSPQRLYDYPANRFVAEFIGDPAMNTLRVQLAEGPDGVHAAHSAFRLPDGGGLDAAARSRTVLGVRPEDLSLADGADDTFEATVTVTEPLGDSLLLECRVGDDQFKMQASPRSRVRPGDTVALRPDPDRIYLFDAETGTAMYHSADGSRTAQDRDSLRSPTAPLDE